MLLLQYYKVLLCTTQYYSSTTKYYSGTTTYYKVLLQNYKVLLQYYLKVTSDTRLINRLVETSCWTPTSTETYKKKKRSNIAKEMQIIERIPAHTNEFDHLHNCDDFIWFLHVMCWYRSRMGTAERDDFTQGGPTYSNYPVSIKECVEIDA